MKKIISLFQRNYDGDRLVRDEIVPGAEWVRDGEGLATRKWDGTCCLVSDGQLYRRYEVKPGRKPPMDFHPATEVDPVTGKQQGWVPVSPDRREDRWHCEAFGQGLPDGTYELCGPKVQGNPEGLDAHRLIPHGMDVLGGCPRTFDALKEYLTHRGIEGVVWHHPDGRMVKIKAKDFGIQRSK